MKVNTRSAFIQIEFMDVNNCFPATHSVLSAKVLKFTLPKQYSIGDVFDCKLIQRKVSDTYQINAETGTYYFRIYRTGWRTKEEIRFELDVIEHLIKKGVMVCGVARTKDGGKVITINAIEGVRYAVLFAGAQGAPLSNLEIGRDRAVWRLGESAALIHDALNDFSSEYMRLQCDEDIFITRPLRSIEPLVSNNQKYRLDFEKYAKVLSYRLSRASKSAPIYGVIHGDFLPCNASYCDTGGVTVFDFDFCGLGWRIFDVCIYMHEHIFYAGKKELADAFFAGYESVRRISDEEWDLFDCFMPARGIWYLGLLMDNADDWGTEVLRNEKSLRHQLNFTRSLVSTFFRKSK